MLDWPAKGDDLLLWPPLRTAMPRIYQYYASITFSSQVLANFTLRLIYEL